MRQIAKINIILLDLEQSIYNLPAVRPFNDELMPLTSLVLSNKSNNNAENGSLNGIVTPINASGHTKDYVRHTFITCGYQATLKNETKKLTAVYALQ